MKGTFRTLSSALAAMLICTGCIQPEKKEEPAEEPVSETETASEESTETDSKALVIYFSRTGEQYSVGEIEKGNTEIVAEMIIEETGADVFEIIPQEDHYPRTYDALTEIAKQEQTDHTSVPYAGELPDLDEYDVIFVGSPVWWGDWPMIMYTLFETNDFSGRTLIPFNTNEGSGLAGFEGRLRSACPDAEVLNGLAVYGHDAQNDPQKAQQAVKAWLSGLKLMD